MSPSRPRPPEAARRAPPSWRAGALAGLLAAAGPVHGRPPAAADAERRAAVDRQAARVPVDRMSSSPFPTTHRNSR